VEGDQRGERRSCGLAAVNGLSHGVQVQRQRLAVVQPVVVQPRGRVGKDDAPALEEPEQRPQCGERPPAPVGLQGLSRSASKHDRNSAAIGPGRPLARRVNQASRALSRSSKRMPAAARISVTAWS
jgi:hypothetical protein